LEIEASEFISLLVRTYKSLIYGVVGILDSQVSAPGSVETALNHPECTSMSDLAC
jgi:hypothetical protein